MPATAEEPSGFSFPTLPEARTHYSASFPLLLSPPPTHPRLLTDPSAVVSHLAAHRAEVHRLLRKHAVLFLRGFAAPTSTPEDFAAVMTAGLGLQPFPYALGNAVRKRIVGNTVFTANEAPPERRIPFHHELAQTPAYPTRLAFYCAAPPPPVGGETPVCHSAAVHDALAARAPRLLRAVAEHGVVYSRVMTRHDRPSSAIGRGWANTFGAHSRADAERALRERGYDWTWLGDGEDAALRERSPVLPAVFMPKAAGGGGDDDAEGAVGGDARPAFFNQIFAAWHGWRDELNLPGEAVRAGNGEKLEEEDLETLKQILEELEVAVPWQRGDVMLIDNMQAMHSRRTFTGKRSVMASLAK